MSHSAGMFFRCTSDEVAPRATIHTLPPELLAETMSWLEFADRVRVSHVDERFREVALGRRDLWEDIALPIRRSSEAAVAELMSRARPGRPLSVTILDIGPDDVNPLGRFVGSYLGRFKNLTLRFTAVELDEEAMDEYRFGLHSLWHRFGDQPANQLVSLRLEGCEGRDPVSLLPYNIFNEVPPPRLRLLYVRGIEFEEPCPAFSRVEHVWVTLAGLSKFASIGELFPGASHILVSEMESFFMTDVDEDGHKYQGIHTTLQDIPPIGPNHRVKDLALKWGRPVRGQFDREAVEWIARSAPFIDNLSVISLEVVDVPGAAFYFTGRESPRRLHIERQQLLLACLDQEGNPHRVANVVNLSGSVVYANSLIVQMQNFAPRLRSVSVASSRIAALAVVPQCLPELWQVAIKIEPETIVDGQLVLPAPAASFPKLPSIINLHLLSSQPPVSVDARSVLEITQIFPNLRAITVHKTVNLFEAQAIAEFLPKPAL